ncbi:MAG: hypothetical protein RSB71_00010 [Bacilli bacterium]
MVDIGMLLYFIPPYFASGCKNTKRKKRLMLVIDKCMQDNTLLLINISKVAGKPNCFTYPFNVLIRKYNPPLPRLSFAKINDNYIVDNFQGLNDYLYKSGQKLAVGELANITQRYNNYKSKNKIELISLTKAEFMTINI